MRLCWVIGRLYGLCKRGWRSHTWRARSNVRRVLVIFFWIIRKSKYCFLEGIGSWGESERTIFWASCSWTRENAQKHRWWCWREDRWCTCTSPIPWTMFETHAILWPWDPEGMCSRSCSFQGYISMSVQKSHHVSRESHTALFAYLRRLGSHCLDVSPPITKVCGISLDIFFIEGIGRILWEKQSIIKFVTTHATPRP